MCFFMSFIHKKYPFRVLLPQSSHGEGIYHVDPLVSTMSIEGSRHNDDTHTHQKTPQNSECKRVRFSDNVTMCYVNYYDRKDRNPKTKLSLEDSEDRDIILRAFFSKKVQRFPRIFKSNKVRRRRLTSYRPRQSGV